MKISLFSCLWRGRSRAGAWGVAATLVALWACPPPARSSEVTAAVAAPERSTPASAAPPEPVSVESLVAEALANNPERRFYDAQIQAARAGRTAAGRLADPELSASVGQKTVRSPGLSTEGVAWSVSLLQPLEWPGRLGLRKAIANQDLALATLGYERFQVALAGRMRSLAFGWFAAQEKAAAASEVAQRFRALREVLVQREPAGLTPLLETRVIEATELNAQRKASEAALAAQAAGLELNQLRGVPAETHLAVAQPRTQFRDLQPTADLLAAARTNNFELRERATELAQQGFRVDLARNERFPAIQVGPTFSEENAGDDRERIVGLVVSLPLPLWNRNRGNVEQAASRQTQAEVSLRLVEREVERKVREAALVYETKRREMAGWRPDSVQHFKEAAEVADRHYRLGAVPIATYVELQKQYLEAVEGLLDTRRETLEAATQLELLTGLTPALSEITPREEQR